MKRHTLLYKLALVASMGLLSACEKDPINILNANTYTADGSLKTATTAFPVGLSIDYDLFLNNAQYRSVVAADAQSTTFGYHMKHGALVRNDGTIDFTKADALYDACKTAGIEVFGHTLGWHQNQNATYLKTITGGGSGPAAVNLVANGSFESGSGDNFNNWGKYNGGTSLVATTVTSEVQAGTKALKVIVTADGNPWNVQMASDEFATTVGKTYNMTFFIKSAVAGGQMRISTGGTGSTAQYSGNYSTSTDWVQKTYSFTANGPMTRVLIDIGSKANTYFMDNVVVVDASASVPPTGGALVTAVDNALKDFITQTVTHYKGKVKAWDVVNEPVSESGTLRTDANTTVSATATDYFFWSKYLGRNWALKAFQYAAAADPSAELYINDYNLESNSVKLDSLIGYVAELKGKGAKITGIGTQMHVLWNTPYSGIDNMFKKLAATGLKVRISELDVRVNPNKKTQFVLNKQFESYQADMYAYIVRSYLTNVPVAQQSGITVWGISDNTSWLYENGLDFPLLYNKDYSKKAAYYAVLKTLKEK
ncbi:MULTISPECIES: endo-1,4-beta-xylanase [unclassified Arcicella]|uniref:endo-1,4-beta-xylanase n=1 Tax=unclassified Arcicella TaxID=2644986 RepID=UPI002864AE4D|nr:MULTISPECIES: endo-1,4-beta-xylanase [unclassified Arcicella]MDR6562814.1 endo-1,4-beta-xylanase [Arcicella sp. BE51]MDR6812844.1 endo-1,4-beta-xylanase [Arcicella sp. BE140]MDR6824156.1 endo-1,4-beta-xylanase [Arcicella sp. BE139]